MSQFPVISYPVSFPSTAFPYAESLDVFTRVDLIVAARLVGLDVDFSQSTESLISALSSYVLNHPNDVISKLTPDEVILIHNLIQSGPDAHLDKRIGNKYSILLHTGIIQVRRYNQNGTYSIKMADELRSAFSPFIDDAFVEAKKAKKQERKNRSQLKGQSLQERLRDLDTLHAEIVQFFFVSNYTDYADYPESSAFWIGNYQMSYTSYFKRGDKELLPALNGYLSNLLSSLEKHNPSLYSRALVDVMNWMTYPVMEFPASLKEWIDSLWDTILEHSSGKISPLEYLPMKISKMIEAGKYKEAAGNLFYTFGLISKEEKRDPEVFQPDEHSVMSNIKILFILLRTDYIYLRSREDLPKDIKEQLDFQLEFFQLHTDLFDETDHEYGVMLSDRKDKKPFSPSEYSGMWEWYVRRLEHSKMEDPFQ